MKKTSLFFLFFFFIVNQFVYGFKPDDEKKFQNDSLEFTKNFKDFMGKNLTEDEELILEKFINLWELKEINELRKEQFVKVCNLLFERGARPKPYFLHYLENVISLNYKDTLYPIYEIWEKSLIRIIENRKITLNRINEYMKNSYEFFENNNLYNSQALRWTYKSEEFKVIPEEDILISFPQATTLICYSKQDSIKIFDTGGIYNLFTNQWKGEKGLVTWERAGLQRDSVNAKLEMYEIDMKTNNYSADSVSYTNKFLLKEVAKGKLEERVTRILNQQTATYPQFISYDNYFKIANLFQNINYEGGLDIQGARVIGKGIGNLKAKLEIFQNDTLRVKLLAKNFILYKNMINSEYTESSIYIEEDSIYHPSINFTYSDASNIISLYASNDILSQSPYTNSYHQLTMSVPQISWKINEKIITLSMITGTAQGTAIFKSNNFFNEQQFDKLQGMDFEHPLNAIYNYTQLNKSNTFHADGLANFMRKSRHQVYQLLIYMNLYGYLIYNRDTKVTTINDNLIDALKARVKMIDYDVIDFVSNVNAPNHNARIDLNTNKLTINGIPNVAVSDSQNVAIIPKNGQIKIQKNRAFFFDGTIKAGFFTFFGHGFEFSYDNFFIDMPNLDSLKISFGSAKKDMYGRDILEEVNSTMEVLQGKLHIDDTNNKSGLKNNPQYPVFQSTSKSYIYYDSPSIYGGVYKRDNFYFEVFPYVIDSLDNFNKSKLNFEGVFYSAGIFSPIEDNLIVMPDNSLGINQKVDSLGVAVYDGKGRFFEYINLSNQGLKAEGELQFLNSTFSSKDMIFFPDSLNTISETFSLKPQKEGIEFPMVKSINNKIHWLPKKDEMFISQRKEPFNIFNDSTFLNGKIRLNPLGLTGGGNLVSGNAVFNSSKYEFGEHEFASASSDFILLNSGKEKKVFTSEKIKLKLNFETKKATFTKIKDKIKIGFPQNQFLAYSDSYLWQIDKMNLEFSSNAKIRLENALISNWLNETPNQNIPGGSLFISTHHEQDSLFYFSPRTDFNLKNLSINSYLVPYIDVADARIYPEKNELIVYENAQIKQLKNSEISANRFTKYHNFYESEISIFGRKSYKAKAYYNYTDENNKIQVIRFDSIYISDNFKTRAYGNALEPDTFTLNPKIQFQGDIHLSAEKPYLYFAGGAKLLHECDSINKYWIKFATEIIPDSIYIPLEKDLKDLNNQRLFSGSFITNDSIHIYPTFFSKRLDYSNIHLIEAGGYLHYDKASDKFKIGSLEKIIDSDLPGNYVNMHSNYCYLYSQGNVNLGIKLGRIKLKTAGSVDHNVNTNTLNSGLLMSLDIPISEKALTVLAEDLDSLTKFSLLRKVNLKSKKFQTALNDFIGKENSKSFNNELETKGFFERTPKELKHTLVFSDIKLKWNQKKKTYYTDEPIGVFSIGNKVINKYLDLKLEIEKKNTGDRLNMYLKIDEENWYLFSYYPGVFQTISNNKFYHNTIKSLKSKETRIKGTATEAPFNFVLMPDTKKAQTLERFKAYEEDEDDEVEDEIFKPEDNLRQGADSLKLNTENRDSLLNLTDSLKIKQPILDSLKTENIKLEQ